MGGGLGQRLSKAGTFLGEWEEWEEWAQAHGGRPTKTGKISGFDGSGDRRNADYGQLPDIWLKGLGWLLRSSSELVFNELQIAYLLRGAHKCTGLLAV